jgi:Ca2+-binding RTX toxin-like protein
MRRTLLLLATMMFALVVAGGVALAASISCPDPSSGLHCVGTDGNDKIQGTIYEEHIFALGGNDTVYGNDGSDHLVGDGLAPSGDPNTKLDGSDKLDGGAGDDGLYGYGRSDTLTGGLGDDKIDAVSNETPRAHNTISAGSGIDEVFANNGVRDSIDCGDGSDSAQVDLNGLDKVADNCEDVDPQPVP